MRGWLCILFISVSILANGQTINIDTETNTRMLARYAETEAILAGMAVGAKEEASLATKERSMADSLMNYSVERMFDYAPGLLYRADKDSRPCFSCEAEADCNWKGSKKNLKILY